jgi:hypothetical protein
MKNIKYKLGIFLSFAIILSSCQDDNFEVGDLTAPSNIDIKVLYADGDSFITNGPGDGTGVVKFEASADNAISYQFVYNNITTPAPAGRQSIIFTSLGLIKYAVSVIAFGTGGISTSKTIEVEVLSTYAPPADLLTMLTSNTSRVWRIENEASNHFGLGPAVGSKPYEFYPNGSDATNAKAGTGMYDDRYTFNIDGTFSAVTNGDVFGRDPLINELGGSGGTKDGADILNYVFGDYTAQWFLTAPGGVETLNLTGLGFIGYYTGGDHKYRIFSRGPDKMTITTTDGNGEFEWWFALVPE